MDFVICASGDKGIRKKVNQDSFFVQKFETETGNIALAVICDGVSGSDCGEYASVSVAQAFAWWAYTSLPLLSQKTIEDCDMRLQWSRLIAAQNQSIYSHCTESGCTAGTTVTAMLLTEKRYYLLNIGDTRAYEIDGSMKQLTVDHTVAAQEVMKGNITAKEAKNSPMASVLTKCVGASPSAAPDFFFGDTKPGCTYLLCCDGFRHKITEKEICKEFLSCAKNYREIKECQEYLIALNKERNETDNISVITVSAV